MDTHRISAVPTNIITGFLGVGKTSAILHLLQSKPSDERWAVLVNEFGEIGIDGSFFKGQHTEDHGVFIREVPGGCMCCTAGLPMQIALNQLLAKAQPDRLLIEPTGLGHPEEVLASLSTENFRNVLSVQKTLTLVDARKLTDPRYTTHSTFNQQIAIADCVVGNKCDRYEAGDHDRLRDYVKEHGKVGALVSFTEYGHIPITILTGSTRNPDSPSHSDHHQHDAVNASVSEAPIPESGYLKVFNQGEGFISVGWRFAPDRIFDRGRLFTFLSGIVAERLKAVFITESGIFAYNLTPDALSEMALDESTESRIEIIVHELNARDNPDHQTLEHQAPDHLIGEKWELQLMACLISAREN